MRETVAGGNPVGHPDWTNTRYFPVETLRRIAMANLNTKSMNELSIVSTLVDAAMAFARGRRKSGVLLLGAAALSSRLPGLGTVTSLLLRLYRRFR